jgi:hypothetical protein
MRNSDLGFGLGGLCMLSFTAPTVERKLQTKADNRTGSSTYTVGVFVIRRKSAAH